MRVALIRLPATAATAFRGVVCAEFEARRAAEAPIPLLAVGEDGSCAWWEGPAFSEGRSGDLERDKGIRWMPWHQEAMKDVARCEKPRGAASRR